MKKAYEAPIVEVVKFQYKDQVVARSGDCTSGESVTNEGPTGCTIPTPDGQYATR